MPERTDALCEHIAYTVKHPHDFYIVDNGSDLVKPSKYTTVYLDENKQTTGGFLAGVDAAVKSGEDYFAYWFIITSAKFPIVDWSNPLGYLMPMLQLPNTFAIHPAVHFNYSAWEQWMSPRPPDNTRGIRRVWGMDYIAALISTEKYHAIGGFRPELTMAWGVPGECNWKARKNGWKLYINDTYVIDKETDIGYDMGRMNMSAERRRELAGKQSDDVLAPIYGKDYREKFRYEYTELGADGDY